MSAIADLHGDMVVVCRAARGIFVDGFLDAGGCGGVNQVFKCRHIFTPAQARELASMLLEAADESKV